ERLDRLEQQEQLDHEHEHEHAEDGAERDELVGLVLHWRLLTPKARRGQGMGADTFSEGWGVRKGWGSAYAARPRRSRAGAELRRAGRASRAWRSRPSSRRGRPSWCPCPRPSWP